MARYSTANGAVASLDIHLFRLLHDSLGGGWLALMAALTVVGGGWGALSILPLFAPSRTRRFALAFVATIVVNAIVVYALKSAIARPRPWMVMPDVHPLVFAGPTDFSFPSGHAAGSFCYATFIAVVLVRTRRGLHPYLASGVLLVLALGVAISRIALGVHFPADVAAGAIVGATIGALGAQLYLRRIKPPAPDAA
jgi:undecaprenyl-diphosphatase